MTLRPIDRLRAAARGDSLAAPGPLALPMLVALASIPGLLFLASGLLGHVAAAAAQVAALVALAPCGILAGRIASARNRERRLRAYWG